MRRIRQQLTYANVISTLCLFLLLGGGTALAAIVVSSNSQVAQNTISGHKPPSGKHANIIGGSVNGQDVANNSITGADVNENSLGRVRYSVTSILGGKGVSSPGGGSCNPESSTYVNCALVTIDLPDSSMVLLSGQATGFPDAASGGASGACRIGAAGHGVAPGSTVSGSISSVNYVPMTTTTVWGPFPAGSYSFGLDCAEAGIGNMEFIQARITAVGLYGG